MKDETKSAMKDLAYYSSLGFSVALAIFIGLFAGVYIDKRFGTGPTWTFIGFGLGIAAGFRNIFHAMRRVQRADEPQKDRKDK
jgi:ATP synthase protein I